MDQTLTGTAIASQGLLRFTQNPTTHAKTENAPNICNGKPSAAGSFDAGAFAVISPHSAVWYPMFAATLRSTPLLWKICELNRIYRESRRILPATTSAINSNTQVKTRCRRNVGYILLAPAAPPIAAQMKAGMRTTPMVRNSMQKNKNGIMSRSHQSRRDPASASALISTRRHGTDAPKKQMSLKGWVTFLIIRNERRVSNERIVRPQTKIQMNRAPQSNSPHTRHPAINN